METLFQVGLQGRMPVPFKGESVDEITGYVLALELLPQGQARVHSVQYRTFDPQAPYSQIHRCP